ncbi:MAG TPA: acyltransferase [Terriglobales bacterium]|nr:acyltransferase [Terriglobales bacterium]
MGAVSVDQRSKTIESLQLSAGMSHLELASTPDSSTADRLVLLPGRERNIHSRFYRPELDLLRFFAFLCVFFHHSLPGFDLSHHAGAISPIIWNALKQAGSFGVCLFFLLSAYLITELLERERSSTGTIHVSSFYRRRMFRIWPLYFAFLAATLALGMFVPAFRIEPGRLLALIFLSGNWYAAFLGCGLSPIAPLWSISVEEQFYLTWPWIAKFWQRSGLRRTSFLLLPVSSAIILWLSRSGIQARREIWANSFVQFQFFALGAILALSLRHRTPTLTTISRLILFLVGLLSWLLAEVVFHIKDDAGTLSSSSMLAGYGLVAIGCLILFLAFLGIPQQHVPAKLAYLGKISYGLYVFHMLALFCAEKVVSSHASILRLVSEPHYFRFVLIQVLGFGISVSLAAASYRFFETPFLRAKERFTFVQSRKV